MVLGMLFLLVRLGLPLMGPDFTIYGVLGGFGLSLAILLWWLLFSRAPWIERIGAFVLIAAGLFGTLRVVDRSISTGAEGNLLFVLAIPPLAVAFAAWAAATRHFSDPIRRVTMVATILLALGAWTLVRTGGFTANFNNDIHWRWTPTPEQRLVAEPPKLPPVPAATPATIPEKASEPKSAPKEAAIAAPKAEAKALWPGFRGPDRDGVVRGVQIKTDWTVSPPVALWRHAVGPGWSSFAVSEDRIYTQEQRGPDEIVACYQLSTGKPVWMHRDAARFWESNGGPGPRGTPTLSQGRVYSLGATGILNVLNAGNGALVWSHNAVTDTGAKIPEWGISGSPLVTRGLAIVAASGRLIAYDRESGTIRWTGPSHGVSYSSPLQMTIDGVAQIVLLTSTGATSVAVADGKLLWEHAWKGYPIVQPAITPDGGLLIAASETSGTRRLAISRAPGEGSDQWTVQERWTSMGLKPYFNDFVVHNGDAYGFDGSIMSCIDLKNGVRKWKGGRYGNGQMVLLADQDLLLVLSEEGELALVSATSAEFKEIARFKAIEGKTWNHPVLVGDTVLVRNGEEMAAFRLSLATN
jgi:hypothetical protein